MMNITERLLAADKASLKRQKKTKEVYSPSLSEIFGEDVNVTIESIDDDAFFEFNEKLTDDSEEYRMRDFAMDVCLAAIVEPDFHKREIYEKFAGALTPEEALAVALSAHEQLTLSGEIAELSGGKKPDKEDVDAVKN